MVSVSKYTRQIGRSFGMSAHTRYFSQLNFSSSRVILQYLEAGQNNPKCHFSSVLSISMWSREFLCRALSLSLPSVHWFPVFQRKKAFDIKVEMSREKKGKMSNNLKPWQCICSTSSQLGSKLGYHPNQLCQNPLGASCFLNWNLCLSSQRRQDLDISFKLIEPERNNFRWEKKE